MISRQIPWTSQPQVPVGVDWTSCLIADAEAIYLGLPSIKTFLFNPRRYNVTIGSNNSPADGTAVVETNVSAVLSGSAYYSKPVRAEASAPYTTAMLFWFNAIPGYNSTVFSIVSQYGNNAGRYLRWDSYAGGAWKTEGQLQPSPAIVANKLYSVIVTNDGSTETLSIKGAPEYVVSSTPNTVFDAPQTFQLCIGEYGGKIACPLLVRSETYWDSSRRAQFHATPWQIFTPLQRRIWVGGATAPPAGTFVNPFSGRGGGAAQPVYMRQETQ